MESLQRFVDYARSAGGGKHGAMQVLQTDISIDVLRAYSARDVNVRFLLGEDGGVQARCEARSLGKNQWEGGK
jgi:hypothetical protein